MSIDGFPVSEQQGLEGYDEKVAARFYGFIERLGKGMHVEVQGLENIPKGRALLVGNHAFGWDSMLPIAVSQP